MVHNDHLGRPEVVTNIANGVIWRANNYAFDRTIRTDTIDGLNLGFPGQYYDEERGLWYNGYRDYDASIGRYLQSDPIGLAGGINTYAYVLGNPVSLIDPLGLEAPGSFNNGGHQLTWERGANIRAPDYIRIQAGIYVVGGSITLPRSGNVYISGGVSRSYSEIYRPGGSVTAGWLNRSCPTSEGVDDHLEGLSMSGAAFYGLGGAQNYSPTAGGSTEIGVGLGAGVSPGSLSYPIWNIGVGW